MKKKKKNSGANNIVAMSHLKLEMGRPDGVGFMKRTPEFLPTDLPSPAHTQ